MARVCCVPAASIWGLQLLVPLLYTSAALFRYIWGSYDGILMLIRLLPSASSVWFMGMWGFLLQIRRNYESCHVLLYFQQRGVRVLFCIENHH